MLISVAAPNASTLVAFVLSKLNVPVKLVVMSPPSTFRSPSRSTEAFLIVVMPLAAPITILVPSPNAFTDVAVAFKRLKVV